MQPVYPMSNLYDIHNLEEDIVHFANQISIEPLSSLFNGDTDVSSFISKRMNTVLLHVQQRRRKCFKCKR